jgi:fructose-1,6-bisphosphatase II / sedoheptulose-1,7-bisphosphatase
VHQELPSSEVLNGIIIDGDKFISETLVTHKNTNFKKLLKASIQ